MKGQKKKQQGITLIALVISIIVMLILAGISLNLTIGDNGIITQAQKATFMQSVAVLQEFLQTEYANLQTQEIAIEGISSDELNTPIATLKAVHSNWFYSNAQGYIVDSESHVLYLINKSGLPDEIKAQLKCGDAVKVSDYYRQKDVFGCTSDLLVYYCEDGIDSMIGLTKDDLNKDNPLEIAYDEDDLLSKIINGTDENGKALKNLSNQDLKAIGELTINTTEKLDLLQEFQNLPNLTTVTFSGLTIPTLEGIQGAKNITNLYFNSCSVGNYSAIGNLKNLNYLCIRYPLGQTVGSDNYNKEIEILCDENYGIAKAELANLRTLAISGLGGREDALDETRISETRYKVTDISPLNNLSTVTKEAVNNIYMPNLSLTSISALKDFKNVMVLRLDSNALTTFDGIQNMSKLTWLGAPKLYSNEDSIATFGNEESASAANATLDALSYIYKDSSTGRNENLTYLDLTNSSNLKYVKYLSVCDSLSTLKLSGCTGILDITSISNVLNNCGTDYKIDGSVGKGLISDDIKVLNISGLTLKETDFEKLKDGTNPNTTLTHLNISNIKLTKADGVTALTAEETNSKINDVLKYCVAMEYLSICDLPSLTQINFVTPVYQSNVLKMGMPNLKEFDARNTPIKTYDGDTSKGGLELLNALTKYDTEGNYLAGIRCLNLTGDGIDFSKIQPTITNCVDTPYWWDIFYQAGLYCNSWNSIKTIENCANIENLVFRMHDSKPFSYNSTRTLNLSGCTSLKKVEECNFYVDVTLPRSLKNLSWTFGARLWDVSACSNLEYMYIQFNSGNSYTDEQYENFFKDLAGCTSLNELILLGCAAKDVTELGKSISYMNNLDKLRIGYYSWSSTFNNKMLSDLSPLESATSVRELTIENASNLKDISWVSNLTNLTSIKIYNTGITSLPDCSAMSNLSVLDAHSNKIVDVKGIERAVKLEELNLENNLLTDTSMNNNNGTISYYYTNTIFSDLNTSQGGSLKKLFLSNNKIEDFSILNDSKLSWEEKSGF